MGGNTFGKIFTITSFGESHGPALGVVLDGVPSQLNISLEDLTAYLGRRRPGQSEIVSSRNEPDFPEILSGIFQGKTLGTPICVVVKNLDQRSHDYDGFEKQHRAGHADRTTELKYGIRDHRGGGRSSGRETLSRVIGGYFAQLILPQVKFEFHLTELGPKILSEKNLIPDCWNEPQIKNALLQCKTEGDSLGGKVKIKIMNVPHGLGEPVFDKLKADLAKAVMSIGGVLGFSYGEEKLYSLSGKTNQLNNNFGGIEGGISSGDPIFLNVFIKAPSTVGEKAKLGRHDPCLIPRMVVVLESMILITLADHYLRNIVSTLSEHSSN
jgi:chorismate synthase